MQCPGDYTKACTEMLTYWLNTYTNATWTMLINALRELQLIAIALEIMRNVKDQQCCVLILYSFITEKIK